MDEHEGSKPRAPVRRFDVFAEYQRQKARAEGLPADEARGYGIWLAKVVAARRFGGAAPPRSGKKERDARQPKADELIDGKWRTLDGKPQTDALFEKEIVDRMGRTFYDRVFAPAIREAIDQGRSYTAIRDTIRREWKPPRAGEVQTGR
jgi:hypothetical protein